MENICIEQIYCCKESEFFLCSTNVINDSDLQLLSKEIGNDIQDIENNELSKILFSIINNQNLCDKTKYEQAYYKFSYVIC